MSSVFQLLPIPELLPFRATPQFTRVFAPLGVEAAIRGPMTRALTSLREIRSVLFCLMDVFVREPTLDWCKYSKKHSTKQGTLKRYFFIFMGIGVGFNRAIFNRSSWLLTVNTFTYSVINRD